MKLDAQIKTLLERAAATTVPAEPQKTLDKKDGEDVTGLGTAELSGEAASAAAGKTGLPVGNNDGGDATPPMQGSSTIADPSGDKEDLAQGEGGREPGKAAAAKAAKTGLPVGNNDNGDATKPAQGSSNTPTPGQTMTQEETEALTKLFTESGVPTEKVAALVSMFESAVTVRIEKEIEVAAETLAESVGTITEKNKQELYEQVNSFMNYVVETWFEKNELAVENGLRTEIAESFINGLRSLFESHDITVPETSVDVLVSMQDQVKNLEAQLNTSVTEAVTLKEENKKLQRSSIVESASKDLVKTDAEKLVSLVEDVEFETPDSFKEKVLALKERYFPVNKGSKSTLSESEGEATAELPEGSIGRYVAAISRSVSGKPNF
jgi:hypothetical protein